MTDEDAPLDDGEGTSNEPSPGGTGFVVGRDPLLDAAYGYGEQFVPAWWRRCEWLQKRRDLMSFGWYRNWPITARLEFKLQDAWIGLYWKVGRCGGFCTPVHWASDWTQSVWEIWIIFVPFCPLHLRIHLGCWLRRTLTYPPASTG